MKRKYLFIALGAAILISMTATAYAKFFDSQENTSSLITEQTEQDNTAPSDITSYKHHEERSLQGFTAISVSASCNVEVLPDSTYRVVVYTEKPEDANRIITTLSGTELTVHPQKGNREIPHHIVRIYMPRLGEVELSSSASCILGGFEGQELEIDLSSSSELISSAPLRYEQLSIDASSSSSVELKGFATLLKIDASSASDVSCGKLTSKHAEVEVSSSADVHIGKCESISYEVSSAGDLVFEGTPKILSSSVNSSGSAKQKK